MRISLTALVGATTRDVVIKGDSEMTVANVAISLVQALDPENPDDRRTPGFRAAPALWADGRMLDPHSLAVRELRDGAVVTVDPAAVTATVTAEPSGLVEIRVVGGPSAGGVHRLGLGSTTLGTVLDADVRLDDPAILGRSLQVVVARDTVTVTVPPGTTATLDGVPLDPPGEPHIWAPGGLLVVGRAVLSLAAAAAPDARLEPLPEGGLGFDPPPRTTVPWEPQRMVVPQRLRHRGGNGVSAPGRRAAKDSAKGSTKGSARGTTKGTAKGTTKDSSTKGTGDKGLGRRRSRAPRFSAAAGRLGARDRHSEFDAELATLRRADEAKRRVRHPDPAEVLLTAVGPRRRLWERRSGDPDALHLRVGLADQPAHIELVDEHGAPAAPPRSRQGTRAAVPIARNVPVTVPLAELGVFGLTGPRALSRGLARWLVAQAATLHSPGDLTIVVLSVEPGGAEHWNWVRWLPHCAPREGADCVALVGSDAESARRRLAELAALINDRQADRRDRQHRSARRDLLNQLHQHRGDDAGPGEAGHESGDERPYHVLVVLDGTAALRQESGLAQVLGTGPKYGVHAICVDDEDHLLPDECAAVAAWDVDRPEVLRLRGHVLDLAGPLLADQVSPAWCERLARALAPVRDLSRAGSAARPLPSSVRLLDLLGMPDPTPDHVLAAWSDPAGPAEATADGPPTPGRPTRRRTRIPIGVSAEGPFWVDLDTEGPHALIAGAPGAGTSELLRTLVTALAVGNRPDEMAFVLFDQGFNQGASSQGASETFGACAQLPHTVRVVTDLDGHAADRILAALEGELRRRTQLLRAAGVNNIAAYGDLRSAAAGAGPSRPGSGSPLRAVPTPTPTPIRAAGSQTRGDREPQELPPLPRLVLIVAELATLAADLPDALAGLVGLGRRGGPAGIHLILATRRPSGVVTADVQAAANLRIALRAASVTDSIDVLGSPEAARVPASAPGRAHLRSGESGFLEPPHAVQCAWISAPRRSGPDATAAVLPLPWQYLGRALCEAPAAASAGLASQAPAPVKGGRGPRADRAATDLAVLVPAIVDAARRAGAEPPPSPWLDPLPGQVTLTLRGTVGGSVVAPPPIEFGLTDLPADRMRVPLTFDLAGGGHLYVAGAARSGRSTTLRTLSGALAASCSPFDVHLYAIDCGAGALQPLTALPHCGAVVARDQPDRVERLITALTDEVAGRQELLAAAGLDSIIAQRAAATAGERLPWMVLMLDRWEDFTAAFDQHDQRDQGRLVAAVLQLLRAGTAVGLRGIFTGDHVDLGDQRLAVLIDRRLVLCPTGGGRTGVRLPPGRALEQTGPHAPSHESQIGLLCADPAGPAQAAMLQRLGRTAAARHGQPPPRLRPLTVS